MQIGPIPSSFVAEGSGIKLGQVLDEPTIKIIQKAINDHGVLVFRNQDLNDDTQAAFACHFGELEVSAKVYRPDNKHRIASRAIIDVSNLNEKNQVHDREDRRRLENLSNMVWHADASFRPVVGALSMLYAYVVPPEGGETEFANMRGAYEALSDATKAKIDNLVGEHRYGFSREQLGFPSYSEDETKALPAVQHPVVRLHRESGRKSLYIGSHVTHIVGWPVPEGRILLHELLEHATQPRFVYRHCWQAGDLVIWDNRCTLHRGRLFDPRYPRDLRRVTTRDVPAAA